MKLAVIGGGSVRSPFLAKSIVQNRDKANLTEVVFMDNDEEKLHIYGKIAKIIAEKIAPDLTFSITTDIYKAVKNADFIITTVRVGKDEGRVYDEKIALKEGILGQETTGAGGFAMAMRSVPVLLKYAKIIGEHAKKDALIFNFTNPSGIVTEALRSEGYNNVYGICDAPSGFKNQLYKILGVTEDRLVMECYGLNHLSWFRVQLDGEDITKDLVKNKRLYTETEMHVFDPELVQLTGNVLLNEYLYFYYYREKATRSILSSKQTRGESILAINKTMTEKLSQMNIEENFEKAFSLFMSSYLERENSYMQTESGQAKVFPKKVPTVAEYIAEPDHGGYAGVALRFVKAVTTGQEVEMVLSVPNNGAIDGFQNDDIVEVTCTINKDGAKPFHIGKIPEMHLNLMKAVKFYEKMTVKAIKEKSINMALMALTAHPLVNSYCLAKKLVQQYLEVHSEFTGEWK